jgi:chitodextrinase
MKKFLSLAGLCALMLGFVACQPLAEPLTAPTDLSQTNVTASSATLSWNAVADADSYNVRLNDGGLIPVASNVYQAIGLTPGTVYNWVVQAVRGDDLGPWSAMMSFVTEGGGDDGGDDNVAIPANLRTTGISTSSATLSWDAVTGATGYEVRFGGETHALLGTTYPVTGLEMGATYTWTVRAVAGASRSNWAAEVTFTTLAIEGIYFGDLPLRDNNVNFASDPWGDGRCDAYVAQGMAEGLYVENSLIMGNGYFIGNIQFHAPLYTGLPIPEGEYIIDDSNDPGYVLAGYRLADFSLAGLWVRRFENDEVVLVTPLTSGTVTMTYVNNRYNIFVNGVDELGDRYFGTIYGTANISGAMTRSYTPSGPSYDIVRAWAK